MSIKRIQNNFLLFCRNMEPEFTFAEAHKFICKEVQDATIDHPGGRLLMAVPPGFGKSTLCSQMLPAFILGNNPKAKILLLTYGATLSDSHGQKCRTYMNTPQYKAIFPEVQIKGAGGSGTFDTEQGGSLRCVGRSGSITGFRANFIICDDTIKNQQEAKSDKIISGLHEWFSTTAYSRLLPGGGIVAFNTRWSKNDLIGFIRDNYKTPEGEPWKYLNLPAFAEEDDPMGRKRGEPLWPEFYPVKMLEEIKRATPKTFSALYQGDPTDQSAVPIKESAIRSAEVSTYEKSKIVLSWDTAATAGAGDWTVCTVWSISKDAATLVEVIRDRVDFGGLIELFTKVNKQYNPVINIIENASSGRQLIQLNQEKCLSSTTIKTDDKEAYAESFNASLLTGKIKILEGILSASDKVELTGYPYEAYDDLPLSILHFYKNFLTQELHLLKNSSSYKNNRIANNAIRLGRSLNSKAPKRFWYKSSR